MAEPPVAAELRAATKEAWNRFLALVDPLRPDLFRYCRRLTGNVWDAEDLIQDTLEQAFARLGAIEHEIGSPRAYVLRIASNLWVDRLRRNEREARALEAPPAEPAAGDPGGAAEADQRVRDAADRLLADLPPQERAAVLLKEVFELSLDETAHALGTTVGAVKAALHRGRSRLAQPHAANSPDTDSRAGSGAGERPSRAVLERFVERFNARDRAGLLALLLDTAAIRMSGVDYEIGRDGFDREPGWLYYNLLNPQSRWEVAELWGEPLVLVTNPATGAVGSVMRFSTVADRVAEVRVYAFCPDAVREVAAALGRTAAPLGLYRFSPALHPPG
ncbi:MAG TPA: RNA polymerase sigma factor [Pseudomonadales bacterium]